LGKIADRSDGVGGRVHPKNRRPVHPKNRRPKRAPAAAAPRRRRSANMNKTTRAH